MTNEKLKLSVVEQIENLSDEQFVQLNNTYCQEANYSDGEIYNNDEDFFDTFFEGKPMEVARSIFYGDYNYSHDYVKFNGYGNLQSIATLSTDDLADTVDNIAEFAIENQNAFDGILDFSEEEVLTENN